MTTLPSRWQEILRREAAENVGTVLAQARERPEGRRIPRWTVPALVVGVGSISLLSVLGGSAPSGGSVPFDRSTVMSTRTAGLGASAEDLAPGAGTAPPATLTSSSRSRVSQRLHRLPHRAGRSATVARGAVRHAGSRSPCRPPSRAQPHRPPESSLHPLSALERALRPSSPIRSSRVRRWPRPRRA